MMKPGARPVVAGFIIFGLTVLVAALGSLVTVSQIPTWYASLLKAPFNPPSWVFGPAWTFLYFTMALAAFLAWHKGRSVMGVVLGLMFYFIQLFLNFLWSYVFFGQHLPDLAFLVICLLWVTIVFTLISFLKLYRPAGYLLVPYLLWVTFAGALNYYVVVLNK